MMKHFWNKLILNEQYNYEKKHPYKLLLPGKIYMYL